MFGCRPDQRGHKPQYGSRVHAPEDRHNRLLHLLGGTGMPPAWNNVHGVGQPITLHQACSVPISCKITPPVQSDSGDIDITVFQAHNRWLCQIGADWKLNVSMCRLLCAGRQCICVRE